uniref:Uncharacterized protein n=1 Tax=Ciona savignyi TaxID=51511 RepID=H2ZNN4_CIOSA
MLNCSVKSAAGLLNLHYSLKQFFFEVSLLFQVILLVRAPYCVTTRQSSRLPCAHRRVIEICFRHNGEVSFFSTRNMAHGPGHVTQAIDWYQYKHSSTFRRSWTSCPLRGSYLVGYAYYL